MRLRNLYYVVTESIIIDTRFSICAAIMIIKSPHPDAVIPDDVSFPTFVLQQLEKYGDKVAMISPQENTKYTYANLISLTHRLASGLSDQCGLKKNNVLATCSTNNCEFLPLVLSVGLLGAQLNTSNPAFTVEELVEQFRKCRVKLVVTSSDFLEKIRIVKSQCSTIEKIIVRDVDVPGCVYLPSLYRNAPASSVNYPKVNARDDVMFLLNSSGTTGVPKAVMLTHYTVVANLCQACPQFLKEPTKELYSMTETDVTLTVFPQFHIGGIVNGMLWPLMMGSTLIVIPRYEPAQFTNSIRTYQVTTLIVPPPILVYLAKSPDVSEDDCRSVRIVFSGAAPITKELTEAVFAKIKPQYIIQGYGMTELSPLCHVTPRKPLSLKKHGSCGVVVPSTECKVTDIESGRALGPNKTGEICIRGPQIMKGYLNNPQATESCIDRDGWMHKGDIGYYDQDEYFYVVDRIKELIKVKAFQVAPAELEGVIISHSAVSDVAVVGVPDEYKGEIPRAYVVLRKGAKTTEDEIKTYVAERVASYKRLDGGVGFVNEIPKNPSGKILRRVLRDRARQETESKKKHSSKL